MKLTYSQYCKLAADKGILPSNIGIYSDNYQLGRVGDKGPYKVGNCRFITAKQNRLECNLNGGYIKGGLKRKGRTKYDDPFFAKISALYAKTFKATSPYGKVYLCINMTEFCIAHDLNKGRASFIARGGVEGLHKGWNFSYLTSAEANKLATQPKVTIWKPKETL